MSAPKSYQMRECNNPSCGLRYPLVEGHPFGERCPLCLGDTRIALTRSLSTEPVSGAATPGQSPCPIEALLDNIRSAWNVGAIFRTADGTGIPCLHLCGITHTPENTSVRKTSLGAENSVAWTYSRSALVAAQSLKAQGKKLWALEQDSRAESLAGALAEPLPAGIVLIVGNEVTGVDPEILDLCERILFIPMFGQKRSLNVEVAFGFAASWLTQM
jgi:tRNA G18 (ribose-2'-O)-methylase SpoU